MEVVVDQRQQDVKDLGGERGVRSVVRHEDSRAMSSRVIPSRGIVAAGTRAVNSRFFRDFRECGAASEDEVGVVLTNSNNAD
jgi:hypothetical protein